MRGALILAIGISAAVPANLHAQGRLRIQPFIGAAAGHDSDVFSTPQNPRADFITRVRPGVMTKFESPQMKLSGRYAFECERFARYSDLTRLDARQEADVNLAYRLTPRTSVSASAGWMTTHTPRDFNVQTGLTAPRAAARRLAGHASVTRQLDTVTSTDIGYSVTEDRLDGFLTTTTHNAVASLERRVSERTQVRGAFRFDAFVFDAAADDVRTHAAVVGLTHALGPRLRLSAEAGPRTIVGRLQPEIAASVACDCEADWAIGYSRSVTAVAGTPGAVALDRLDLTLARTFGRAFEIQMTPAVLQSTLATMRARVYALAVHVSRSVAPRAALHITVQGSVQQGGLYPGGAGAVLPRHAVLVSLVSER